MNAPTPGWNPDPTGRHEYRYWDGGAWTDDVSDNGVTSVDPVDGPGPFGGEPTSSIDPTQQYAPQPGPPTGPPVGGYGAQPGPQPGAYGPQPGAPGYDPYGSGQVPPGQPVKTGPPTGLIIGLVVVAVALIVGLVVVLTGGDDDTATDDTTTTTGEPTDDTTATTATTATDTTAGPEDADVFSLAIGDCLVEDSSGGEVEEVPVVPCDQPHASEVYFSHIIDGDELPDATEMETIAADVCVANFESYVGLPYAESVYVYTVLQPTQGSWDSGDRELLCLLADPAGDMTGSAAGSNR